MMTKRELRQFIRQQRLLHSVNEGAAVISQLQQHPRIAEGKTILLYCALPDEVPTMDFMEWLTVQGKRVLLPRVISDTDMELRRYTGHADLEKGAFGILEPVGETFTDYAAIDVAVVPGMAFDREGHRLGRGKGYYDRFLSRIPYVYKIGVCFPWQVVDSVPTDGYDMRMDEVIF